MILESINSKTERSSFINKRNDALDEPRNGRGGKTLRKKSNTFEEGKKYCRKKKAVYTDKRKARH